MKRNIKDARAFSSYTAKAHMEYLLPRIESSELDNTELDCLVTALYSACVAVMDNIQAKQEAELEIALKTL